MRTLSEITLIGADCVNAERLARAMDICQKEMEFGAVKLLTSLPLNDPRRVEIAPLTSIEAYSTFCIRELHRYVDTPYALIVQHDGFILNPDAWDARFLEWDYIGAPWYVQDFSVNDFGFPREWLGSYAVGNGGFSLRSKKLLQATAALREQGIITQCHPEDVVISVTHRQALEERGIRFTPTEIAERFSFEALDTERNAWTNEFGFHGLRWTDISAWTRHHPEYAIDNPAAQKAYIGPRS